MATVSKWTPFGVALDITATGSTVTRTSATQYTVKINVSWETYYSGAKTNYGMSATSGGKTVTISSFGTSRSSGSNTLTGTYSISGNGSASKSVSVSFRNYNSDNGDSATKSVSFNVTVPAWTSYTVKYNANGGSGAPANQTKWKDQALKLSTTKPTRTGYTFQGWGTSASDTSVDYVSGANYASNASITLYAIWKVNTFTIKYNGNASSGVSNVPSNQTKTYGTILKLSTTTPTRASVTSDNGTITTYTFKGWATSASSSTVAYKAGANYTANSAATLYAVWSTNTSVNIYSVMYDSNGGSEVISQIKTMDVALKLRTTTPVRVGYTFEGWGLTSDASDIAYFSGDNYEGNEDITLYAIWSPMSHNVSFDANGGTGNVPDSFVKTTGMDAMIHDAVPTMEGYVFKCWNTNPNGLGGHDYYVGDGYNVNQNGGDVILYAVWKEKRISLVNDGTIRFSELVER